MTEKAPKHVLDRWLLARLAQTTQAVTAALDTFEHWKATEVLERFIDDCSTWYLRRSRERLKADPANLGVLIETLKTTAQLLAPFIPFSAEAMYRRVAALSHSTQAASVHLLDWPVVVLPFDSAQGKLAQDDNTLLEEMATVRQLAELAHAARAKAGFKLRQPLAELQVVCPKIVDREALFAILREEVNVKAVTSVEKLEAVEGWQSESSGSCSVALNVTLDAGLKDEGLVRELIRQLNALRKQAGLTPSDRIRIEIASATPALAQLLKHHEEEVLRGAIAQELALVSGTSLQHTASFSLEGTPIIVGLAPLEVQRNTSVNQGGKK